MGNRIASDLIDALRNSTLGTTLCSRSETKVPEFVEISKFPGVAKAFVVFDGDTTKVPNTPLPIRRAYNITSVLYLGLGKYKVIFKSGTFSDSNYVISGSLQPNIYSLSAANMFYVVNDPTANDSRTTSFSSCVVYTLHTSTSGTQDADARRATLTFL